MKSLALLVLALLLAAASASAADINGTWKASLDTPNGKLEITFVFKVDGSKLTGTTSSQFGERPLSDGKIDGDNLSFNVKWEGPNGEFVISYKGKVSGDEMKLSSTFPGRDQSFEMTAKKVS